MKRQAGSQGLGISKIMNRMAKSGFGKAPTLVSTAIALVLITLAIKALADPPLPKSLKLGSGRAILLSDSKALIIGGDDKDYSVAEIYDPVTETRKRTGSLNIGRKSGFTMTLLPNGMVLVTGGLTNISPPTGCSSTELYNPNDGKWKMAAPMSEARYAHTAALLKNGTVLVAGGRQAHGIYIITAEIYNPAEDKWTMTGSMSPEAGYTYTSTLLTNGQVLLTTGNANMGEACKELYDPATGQWKGIGPPWQHIASSKSPNQTSNNPTAGQGRGVGPRSHSPSGKIPNRTLTISPESGSTFVASEDVQMMVTSADRFGVTNIQLFRDDVKIADGAESPLRFNLTNMAAGTYSFLAKAGYGDGAASTSSVVTITFKTAELQVGLAPGPTEFISERYVKSSPGILLAAVVGISPASLAKLTLNDVPQPLRTGNFILNPPLAEGKNVFVLVATDKDGKTAKATTEIYLDTSVPIISIIEPTNNSSINAMWVDLHGRITGKNIKRIQVGGMWASMKGDIFEAPTVFLMPGTNLVTVMAVNASGNVSSNTIIIMGPTSTNTAQTFPVTLDATPPGGFAPLAVTFTVQAHVPGVIQKVVYHFDEDGTPDEVATDLHPVKHVYKNSREYSPVVTVQTSVGRFSSLGAIAGLFFGGASLVDVEQRPVLTSTIKITNPVAVKWTAKSNLYVLSGSAEIITEFDSRGKIVRSKKGIGPKPSGIDVDGDGNVYVAVTGNNQVWKFKTTADSFEADTSFGNGGFIGKKDGSSGTNANEFNAPYDIALSRDGQSITVSDTGNRRILQFGLKNPASPGQEIQTGGQIAQPKGLSHDEIGIYLMVADSENNRIALADSDFMFVGTSGTNGEALGQFSEPTHIAANKRALYVADTGNNRIQVFSHVHGGEGHSPMPLSPRVAIGSELGLKQPMGVCAVDDFLEEKFYIADTGNNRVLLVKLPTDNPEAVWKDMKARLKAGDVEGAMSDFSVNSRDKYEAAFMALSKDELLSVVKDMGELKPSTIERDSAEYYFESLVEGRTITFPVEFDKENGAWKIMEY